MTASVFSDAMGEISEKYIMEAVSYKSRHPSLTLFKRRVSVAVIAAILALFLMGAGVVAVIYGDSIQNWFSHHWETITGNTMSEEHMTVINKLSQEVGVSQTIGDVTVSVDSATIGDDVIFMLLRVEGIELSDQYNYSFDEVSLRATPNPVENEGFGGYGIEFIGLDGNGTALFMLDYKYASAHEFEWDSSPVEIVLTLENFMYSSADEQELLHEGVWNYTFTLDRSQQPECIQLPDTEIVAMDLKTQEDVPLVLTHVELTSTGLRFQYNDNGRTRTIPPHIRVVLENGAEVRINGGYGTPMIDGKSMSYSYQWNVPVNLDEVAAVIFDTVEIPVPNN